MFLKAFVVILQAILEHGVDSEETRSLVDFATQREGQTAVHLAAENATDNADVLAAVIQHSSNVNAKDCQGEQVREYHARDKYLKKTEVFRLFFGSVGT